MRPRLWLLALLVPLAACDEEFKPETVVDSLRVLGMRAQPAELLPGETAVLSALVEDPSRPGQKTSILWLACDPDPFNLGRNACSDTSLLSNLGTSPEGGDGGTPQLPPGMHVVGFNDRAAYSAPKDLFSVLPAEDARRRIGSVAQVLAVVIAEEVSPAATPEQLKALLERVKAKEVRSLMVLFRIRVSEERPPNQNPRLEGLWIDGEPHPAGAQVRVRPAAQRTLELRAPDASFEEYDQLTPEGSTHKTERLLGAWYSTFGRFKDNRVALGSGVATFTAPGTAQEPAPDKRAGFLWAVLRDTRGGQAWERYPLWLCDESVPGATASAVSVASPVGEGALVTLRGVGLEGVADVLVGGRALSKLGYSPGRDVLEGLLPALPKGSHPVQLSLKNCEDVAAGLSVEVP